MLVADHYAPDGVDWTAQPLAPAIARIAAGSFKAKNESHIHASGYVVHTLEAALWAFHESDNLREGALLAVNLGDDADTPGAVLGQLAGAYYGAEGIPLEWRTRLTRATEIESLAKKLFHLATP